MLFEMSLVIFLIRLMKFLHFVVQLSHCRFVPGQGNLFCSLPFLPFSTVKGKAALFSTMDQHTGYRGVLAWKSISARDMEPPHHECHVTRLGVHLCFSICIHQSGKAFYSKVFFKYLLYDAGALLKGAPTLKNVVWACYDEMTTSYILACLSPHFSDIIHCFALFRLLQVSDQKQKYRKDSNAVGKYDTRLIWIFLARTYCEALW